MINAKALDSIQSHLEDPFDQVGGDDITINAEKLVEGLAIQSRPCNPGLAIPAVSAHRRWEPSRR